MTGPELHDLLEDRLAHLMPRDSEMRRGRLDSLLRGAAIEPADRIDLLLAGPATSDDDLEGLTDADAIVVLEPNPSSGASPEALPGELAAWLRRRGIRDGVDAIRSGRRAVTVAYRDGRRLRLLPAMQAGEGARMATHNGRDWFGIGPAFFASALTSEDARLDGRLVPVIKLAKLAIAGFPADRRLTGYHAETLAIAVFRAYPEARSIPEMLEHLFHGAASAVQRPLVDSAGRSLHIDDDLGPPESAQRARVAEALADIEGRMRQARGVAEWAALLPVPAGRAA